MFLAHPPLNIQNPAIEPKENPTPEDHGVYWPVVFTNVRGGGYSEPVGYRETYAAAQQLAEALNNALNTAPETETPKP